MGLHSLQESRFVLVLDVRSELDLGLDASEQTRLIEGDGVRAVQDVVPGLEHTEHHQSINQSINQCVI